MLYRGTEGENATFPEILRRTSHIESVLSRVRRPANPATANPID